MLRSYVTNRMSTSLNLYFCYFTTVVIHVTYCSVDKSKDPQLIPAASRYLSNRIDTVHALSKAKSEPFFILSGEFGLINCMEPIPWYDHLLQVKEIHLLSKKVSTQLLEREISVIYFHSRRLEDDPYVHRYIECVEQACALAKIELKLVFSDFLT